jgi:hypothetical protein
VHYVIELMAAITGLLFALHKLQEAGVDLNEPFVNIQRLAGCRRFPRIALPHSCTVQRISPKGGEPPDPTDAVETELLIVASQDMTLTEFYQQNSRRLRHQFGGRVRIVESMAKTQVSIQLSHSIQWPLKSGIASKRSFRMAIILNRGPPVASFAQSLASALLHADRHAGFRPRTLAKAM